MTSLNRQKGIYVYAEDGTDGSSTDYDAAKQRHATVYDAVAGKSASFPSTFYYDPGLNVTTTGRVSLKFSKVSAASCSRKNASGHHQLAEPILAPEEVLFSRKNAPQRYAEKDVYFANEGLPDGGRDTLPDSDMLKAVHGYASHFYEALGQRHDQDGTGRDGTTCVNERSMDDTALLAFGILLEEAARESLGKDGDLVFTEGVQDDDASHVETELVGRGPDWRSSQAPVGFEGEGAFWKRKYSKRRKIEDDRA